MVLELQNIHAVNNNLLLAFLPHVINLYLHIPSILRYFTLDFFDTSIFPLQFITSSMDSFWDSLFLYPRFKSDSPQVSDLGFLLFSTLFF